MLEPLDVRSVYMWGLAKNTGKTVALNHLLERCVARGEMVGVTSVGRDGEAVDAIDARITKPRVHVEPGTMFATCTGLLQHYSPPATVLRSMPDRTPVGQVVVCRADEPCTVEIAGPSSASRTAQLVALMQAQGCDRVLIDGALGRRAAAAPSVADGIVLSTGAVLSTDPEDIVAQTRHAVRLIELPSFKGRPPVELGSGLLRGTDSTEYLLKSTLRPCETLSRLAKQGVQPTEVFISGALTDEYLRAMLRLFPSASPTLVVRDFARLFVSTAWWDRAQQEGISVAALQTATLIGITVNPWSQSHRFPSRMLRGRLADAFADYCVVDIIADLKGT